MRWVSFSPRTLEVVFVKVSMRRDILIRIAPPVFDVRTVITKFAEHRMQAGLESCAWWSSTAENGVVLVADTS